MAWTAPFTAVAGSVFQAAQFNTYIRDNLNETAPAKATVPGSIFAVTGTNAIAERTPVQSFDNSNVDITSTTFAPPAAGTPGPSVTVTTGVMAIVGVRALVRIPDPIYRVEVSYAISGATTRAASSSTAFGYSISGTSSPGLTYRGGVADLVTGLTPGVNTFTMQYNVSAGQGLANGRRIWVLPL